MPLQNLTKRLGANWMDQRQTERQPRGDMEDLSATQSRAQLSQRRRKEKGGGWGILKGVMQAGENDAKAPALRVILS